MTQNTSLPEAKPPPEAKLALRFDWQDWLEYFDDDEATLEQKQALIETLWGIVCSFVDLGWDLNPTAQICGQEIDLKALLERDVLSSEDHPTPNFAVVAKPARKEDAA